MFVFHQQMPADVTFDSKWSLLCPKTTCICSCKPHRFGFLYNGSCGGVSVYRVTSSTSKVAQIVCFTIKIHVNDTHLIRNSQPFTSTGSTNQLVSFSVLHIVVSVHVSLCQLWLATTTPYFAKCLQRCIPTRTKMPVQTHLNAGK